MRVLFTFLLLISLTGCGSKSADTANATVGVPLSIKSPAAETQTDSAQKELPASISHAAVEQLIQKARAAVNAGQRATAIEALSQAIGTDPGDSRLFRMRGDVYALMGENANARADYSLAIQADPQNADLYNVRGYFLMTHGSSAEANRDFDRAIELNPELPQAWNNRGLVHLANEDYTAAAADFTKAFELDRKYADAVNNRGFARMKMGRMEEALADLKLTVEIKPDYTTAWNNRGLVYMQQENYDAAVTAFSEAVRLAPLDARWLNHRRAAYLKLERFEEASADARKIEWLGGLTQLTNQAAAQAGDPQAWIRRAGHLAAGSEFGAATQDYSRALSLDPANTAALQGRALAWLKVGDWKKAIADCDEALVQQPSGTAFSIRGDAWYALQNYDQAIQDFEAAGRFDDVVAEAYRERASAHEKAGNKDLAERDRTKAEEIMAGLAGRPDNPADHPKAIPFPE